MFTSALKVKQFVSGSQSIVRKTQADSVEQGISLSDRRVLVMDVELGALVSRSTQCLRVLPGKVMSFDDNSSSLRSTYSK